MARRVSPDVGGRDGSQDVSGCKSCSKKFSWFSTPKVTALSSAISECRCVGVFVVAFIDDKWEKRGESKWLPARTLSLTRIHLVVCGSMHDVCVCAGSAPRGYECGHLHCHTHTL
jgi:hypothetical protein